MPRQKGTSNTPQNIIDEIVEQHRQGKTKAELAREYGKPFKTIRNMITRENNKARQRESRLPLKARVRKPAVTIQEYKYECERLRMENELLRDFLHLVGRK